MKEQASKNLLPRPPVVAVVGHVDHGKTTLLDYVRKTAAKAAPKGGEPRPVAGREAGGITQSIGAYEVEHQDKKITFIDTPGHEAFTKMRARGASAADLAILVVAADDGVMPQTKEAISVLKTTETPFIVAITKVDLPNANIEKVKNDLLANEVLLEGYGGNTSWQEVSGVSGEGVPELLDLILLTGEVIGLTFDPNAEASGFVIESKKESRRGIVAHLVLKDGALRVGAEVSTPTAAGKIKILEDSLGNRVKELSPSAPAEVVGFLQIPRTGEEFTTGGAKPTGTTPPPKIKPESAPTDLPRPRVILRADTTGSLEAMEALLRGLVDVAEEGVGEISDGDVNLAKSTGSIVVGFRVEPVKSALRLADSQQVKIITSDIIYKLVEAVTEAVAKEEKKVKASLEVLAVFSTGTSKKTVGGKVVEGILRLGSSIEIERDVAAPEGGAASKDEASLASSGREPRPGSGREVVGKGKITNLQKDKVDVKEVSQGSECGLVVETAANIEVGDILRVI